MTLQIFLIMALSLRCNSSISWRDSLFLGNTVPSGQCAAGYYCTQGANSSTPTDGVTGNICPAGKYCEIGSITGTGCPKGTFSSLTGLTNATECEDCTGGYYCSTEGLTTVTGTCWAGRFVSIQYTHWFIRGRSVPCQDLLMLQNVKIV